MTATTKPEKKCSARSGAMCREAPNVAVSERGALSHVHSDCTGPAGSGSVWRNRTSRRILAANTVLLGGYLFGCHSMRQIAGGCVDQLSRAPMGVRVYSCVSC